jgi:hypothetical protein
MGGGRGFVRAGQTSGRVEGGVMRPAPSAGDSGGLAFPKSRTSI